jgi:hypothetical protein
MAEIESIKSDAPNIINNEKKLLEEKIRKE